MIRLTRLNRMPMVLNSDLIEHIDITPDTVITMTNGQILRVLESADEVVHRIVAFRREIGGVVPVVNSLPDPEGLSPSPPGQGRRPGMVAHG
jgi:flagellar protein FlbD